VTLDPALYDVARPGFGTREIADHGAVTEHGV
jgi:hypothetical protein